MRYLGEDDATRMMGVGYLGEVRQGPDGALYQYVQGVDGLGNPFGFWSRLKRLARRAVQKALPIAQQFAPFIPGGAAALTAVTPFLKQAGVAGHAGLGALYEAPDGSLYQVQGLAENDLRGVGENETTQMMGVGYLGEVRRGPDGALYQYVQGVDGLGNPFGFWSRLKRLARRAVQKALPIAQQFAPFIPGGAAAPTAVTPFLKQAGVAGHAGLGALYEAPDGSLYQVQGLAEDELRGIGENETTQMMGIGNLSALYQAPDGTVYQQVQGLDDDTELRGLDADDELHGLDDDPELRGFDEGEELRGFEDDMELRGLDDDSELRGLDDSEDLRGFDEDRDIQGIAGYVRQDGMSGLERYEPELPPQTRWHVPSAQQPKVWKRAW